MMVTKQLADDFSILMVPFFLTANSLARPSRNDAEPEQYTFATFRLDIITQILTSLSATTYGFHKKLLLTMLASLFFAPEHSEVLAVIMVLSNHFLTIGR